MNYFEVDGRPYDVIVTKIQRGAEIRQSENAGATLGEGAEETLDPLGTFINHIVTVKRRKGNEAEFDRLWDCVTMPRYEGVWVNVAYNQATLKYKAKFSVSPQNLERVDKRTGRIYWGEMTINILPTKAQILPE